jgi:2-polyprenyl-6-hydroxyphenyl methylase/3-demethylubiquinone-9 3-methyltransferase
MKPMVDAAEGYAWPDAQLTDAHGYLLPALVQIFERETCRSKPRRLFDLGCGNGTVANALAALGWQVTGVDPSPQGIAQANSAFPHLPLDVGSALGQVDVRHRA